MPDLVGDCSDPPLRFSRAHKKSKNGCSTCKERKVKCDEARPVCRNCATRCRGLLKCQYPINIPVTNGLSILRPKNPRPVLTASVIVSGLSSRSSGYSSPTIPVSSTPLPQGISPHGAHRRLEMRLLHHYTTITCYGLPRLGSTDTEQIWTRLVPQLAFKSDLVLDGIMLYSAFHLRTLYPRDSSLESAETMYVSRALASHRKAIEKLGVNAPKEVFTAALLIFHYFWLTENLAAVAKETKQYQIPTRVYHLAAGMKPLFVMLPDMHINYLDLYCPHPSPVEVLRPHQSRFIESVMVDLEKMQHIILGTSSSRTLEDQRALTATLFNFTTATTMFSNSQTRDVGERMLVFLPLRSEYRFIGMLDEQEPLAMAIYARNLALISVCKRTWSMHGAEDMDLARLNVRGIESLMPKEWKELMVWPLEVVEGRIRYDVEIGDLNDTYLRLAIQNSGCTR